VVQLRLPADHRIHGPVVTRDTHVPLPRRRDDEDVAMLGGLPCASEGMRSIDIPTTWHADFLARLANVPRNDREPALYVPFADTHGSIWTWI
jgi:hypothetical protein